MKLIPIAAAALLLFQAAPAPKTKDVAVSVTYKGKGVVDAGHKIIVYAFADPDITSASRPIDTQFSSKNGETVTFKSPSAPVYIFAVYDEKGTYDGVSGPPPAGTPSATYRKAPTAPKAPKAPKAAPVAVAPGSPAVKFTFDDSERWSK